MKRRSMTLWLTLFCLVLCASAHADSFDANHDFSITNGNPNGVWTYGVGTPGVSFNAFTHTSTGSAGCFEGNFQCWTDNGYVPTIGKNPDSTPEFGGTHEIPADSLVVHPAYGVIGAGNNWVIVRWTAPAAGTISYSGETIVYDFGQQTANPYGTLLDTALGAIVNQVGNLSGAYGTTLAFNGTAHVTAGETFDVAVGVNTANGNTNYSFLPTGFNENISYTPTPEPASVIFLASGLCTLSGFKRWLAKR